MAGSAMAQSVGNAIIENMCSYNVELTVVPAQNGGYETTQHTLNSGGSYSTQWKELSTGAGWSLKLSKDQDLDHILQYEYTFQDDGTAVETQVVTQTHWWDHGYHHGRRGAHNHA